MVKDTFIIAVKREQRGSVPADWQTQIGRIPGVQVLSGRTSRLQVSAAEDVISAIRSKWSHLLHIEREVLHKPQPAAS